jgi:hypothetical protein
MVQAFGIAKFGRFEIETARFVIPKTFFNGIITNDKFCMIRTARLHLTWWRRALRSRPTHVADEAVYPSNETSRRGGTHETSMENPPPVD